MQVDFHYYAVYALGRLAGYDHLKAETIAYASQYTDDAVNDKTIHFENGETFKPTLTAYVLLSPGSLTRNVQEEVFTSFHFLPGVDPTSDFDGRNRENLVTKPGCSMASTLVDLALKDNSDIGLHRLGLALHTFADTFAHQDFSGFAGPENDAEDVVVTQARNSVDRFFRILWHKIMEAILPAIGHAEVGHLPDEPFRKWEYFNYSRHKNSAKIDNAKRYLQASKAIFEKLGGKNWDNYAPKFEKLFRFKGAKQDRCNKWKMAIESGLFGFTAEDLNYDPNFWEESALKKNDDKKNTVIRKDGFESSNWVRFNAAAQKHRNYVLKELARLKSRGLVVKPNIFKAMTNKLSYALVDLFKTDGRKSFSLKSFRRGLFRFVVYGAFLVCGEVAFYSLIKIGREAPDFINWLFQFQWSVDSRLGLDHVWDVPIKTLYGQASLWMFFVYATIGLFGIEPFYKRMKDWKWSWLARGFVYMLIILSMECAAGWLIWWSVKYKIWYYSDSYDILTFTSWAIAPFWFILGLVSENFINLVLKYSQKKARLKQLEISP